MPDRLSGAGASAPKQSGWRLSSLTDHLMLKVAALLLALMLWLVVSAREPTAEVIPVRFEPLLDQSLTLVSPIPPMRALVIGEGRDLLKLYSTPPVVRRVINASVTDTFTLELQPSDVDIPVNVDAIVRDIQPRSVKLTFAATARKMVPVRSTLKLTAGGAVTAFGAPHFEPDSVVIVGPRQVVMRVGSVPTVAIERLVCGSDLGLMRLDTSRLGVSVRPRTVQAYVSVVMDTARAAAGRGCAPPPLAPR